jgi:serine/threonine-protein kinase RsbW
VTFFRASTLQPLHRAFLQVNTDLDALEKVLEWFDQFNHPPIHSQAWMQCQLAVAEGFTNAVRHAHRNLSAETLIDLEVQVFEDRIEIRIWDQGAPFDLDTWIRDLPLEWDKEAEGKRGIRLMHEVSDLLSYIRMPDDRNCLLILKKV